MGFYLRKSFRLGPLRLNLSRSGVGLSAGVPGGRLGVSAKGHAYVHAGHGGLYYRRDLGAVRRRAAATSAGRVSGGSSSAGGGGAGGGFGGIPSARHISVPCDDGATAALYADTGATYPPPAVETNVGADRDALSGEADARLPAGAHPRAAALLAAGAGGAAIAALATSGAVRVVAGAAAVALLLAWTLLVLRARGRREARSALRRLLESACVEERPLAPASVTRIEVALRDARLEAGAGGAELRALYLRAALRAAADGRIGEGEATLLRQLEERFAIDAAFCTAARRDAYHAAYAAAVADRDLTRAEESALEEVRGALELADDDVAPERGVLERLRRLREIRGGELATVDAGVPLPEGETCHYRAPARLLREKVVRRFQRAGRRYSVRGLVVRTEGTLLVTDRRVLVVAEGTTSVPLTRILDVDVDLDRNVLRITEDGRKRPVLITTPDAGEAGAVVAGVGGM